ncbi:MAG: DUF1232 domain-containing protein [Verrucomicrobiota bacterium JB023]|nr:DUF1232 domain-containing protein [Verrucomicrobiota bacterium JB023]
MKKVTMALVGLLSLLYILNPTMGVFELIPDNFPVIGNLDEAAATALLLTCLSYFGIDIPKLFGGGSDKEKRKETIDVE